MGQERKFDVGDVIIFASYMPEVSYVITGIDVSNKLYLLKSNTGNTGFTSFQNEHLWRLSDEGVVARILGKYATL